MMIGRSSKKCRCKSVVKEWEARVVKNGTEKKIFVSRFQFRQEIAKRCFQTCMRNVTASPIFPDQK